jgi:uncharacterized protein (TIGR03118 family)
MNARLNPRILLLCAFGVVALSAAPQSNNYRQVNLVSSAPGLGLSLDPALARPWGLSFSIGQPIRVANNSSGTFRSYDATGRSLVFAANIALPAGSAAVHSNPSGVAANSTNLFAPHGSLASPFLFATEDGTISGEYADTQGNILSTTILAVDNSPRGAVYTGIAVLTPDCCAPFLAAADFHGGFVDTFTGTFDPLGTPGIFTDPNLPSGYAPYNLNIVEAQVFITYALQNGPANAPVVGVGKGIVDVYDLAGTFVRRFASNGALNAPWAVVKASADFGAFSGDILIGNAGDGSINAFDSVTGAPAGPFKDGNGNPIINPGLHGMIFGDGVAGDRNTLYIAAGPSEASVFGAISYNAGGTAPDFTLLASPSAAILHQGEAATFVVTAIPTGDFRGLFSFSCIAPAGVTCTVSSTTVEAATGAGTVSIATTSSSTARLTQAATLGLPFTFFAWLGIRSRGWRNRVTGMTFRIVVFFVLALGLLGVIACGGSKSLAAPAEALPIVVTANVGSISHSTTLTLTVH